MVFDKKKAKPSQIFYRILITRTIHVITILQYQLFPCIYGRPIFGHQWIFSSEQVLYTGFDVWHIYLSGVLVTYLFPSIEFGDLACNFR
jgi:hypothetical protein